CPLSPTCTPSRASQASRNDWRQRKNVHHLVERMFSLSPPCLKAHSFAVESPSTSECRLLSRYRRRRMRDIEVVGAGGALEINSPAKSMERRARASLVTIPPSHKLGGAQLKAE